MNRGNSHTATHDDDRAHPAEGCAAAPYSMAAVATAQFVRAIVETYAEIGRPLPDLGGTAER